MSIKNHVFLSLPCEDVYDNRMTTKFLELFPEEIWIQILQKLDNDGKRNATNAALLFRKILLPDRQTFLFPFVLEVLVLNNKSFRVWPVLDKNRRLDERSSWQTIFFGMRLTCKYWCQCVDSFYEDLHFQKALLENDLDPAGKYFKRDRDSKILDLKYAATDLGLYQNTYFHLWCPWRNESLDKFKGKFNGSYTGRNPFIGRSVKIIYSCNAHALPGSCTMANEIVQFLEKFGRHIWYLRIKIGALKDESFIDYLKRVSSWFRLVPSLRYLYWDYEEKSFEEARTCSKPVPVRFPKLTHLKAVAFRYLPISIGRSFMRRNLHVEVIQQPGFSVHPGVNPLTLGCHLHNLKQLSLRVDSWKLFEHLETFKTSWRLEKVQLVFDLRLRSNEYLGSWPRVFKLFERWRETLNILTLELSQPNTLEQANDIMTNTDIKADLPNLVRLRLVTRSSTLVKYFFLCSSLEVLEIAETEWHERSTRVINNKTFMKQARKECILFTQSWSLFGESKFNLPKSNVWKVFPRLRRVNISPHTGSNIKNYRVYSRRKYDTSVQKWWNLKQLAI